MVFFVSVQAHLSPNTKFDFHKYIKRSLEDDFKVVVGIRFKSFLQAPLHFRIYIAAS
jgi:mlo protein